MIGACPVGHTRVTALPQDDVVMSADGQMWEKRLKGSGPDKTKLIAVPKIEFKNVSRDGVRRQPSSKVRPTKTETPGLRPKTDTKTWPLRSLFLEPQLGLVPCVTVAPDARCCRCRCRCVVVLLSVVSPASKSKPQGTSAPSEIMAEGYRIHNTGYTALHHFADHPFPAFSETPIPSHPIPSHSIISSHLISHHDIDARRALVRHCIGPARSSKPSSRLQRTSCEVRLTSWWCDAPPCTCLARLNLRRGQPLKLRFVRRVPLLKFLRSRRPFVAAVRT